MKNQTTPDSDDTSQRTPIKFEKMSIKYISNTIKH